MLSLKDIMDKVVSRISPQPVKYPQPDAAGVMENEEAGVEADADWENRRLCSDESCIGAIGPDGRCRVCGKPYDGELEAKEPSEKPEDQAAPEPPRVTVETGEAVEPVHVSEEDGDWENRRLCSDGDCIGVIGPDGRCKECGKPYEGD